MRIKKIALATGAALALTGLQSLACAEAEQMPASAQVQVQKGGAGSPAAASAGIDAGAEERGQVLAPPHKEGDVVAALPVQQTIAVAAPDSFGTPLDAAQLSAWRGGADTVSNDMRLNGAVSGNTAFNVATGMNTISSGSFSNASGLPVAIQNSGANVLIQNATIINIQLQ